MADIELSKNQNGSDKPKWGKRKRGGKKQNANKKANQDRIDDPSRRPDPRDDIRILIRENEKFDTYYKAQPFIDGLDEYEKFLTACKGSLPASFRINTFDMSQAKFLRNFVQGPQFKQIAIESNKVEENSESKDTDVPIKQVKMSAAFDSLPWYPDELAWQMNITRIDLRKNPILQALHKLIMAETDNGFISRQETVSMIPPLVLDVHRGHTVLDMCAAPGSKTAQLLEYLKQDISPGFSKITNKHNKNGNQDELSFDQGMIVANDVDNKRCYMLVHQSSRLNSPNCIIINEDASRLPEMKMFDETQKASVLKFDRILCDVPCTGDGTMRKNVDVWKKWTVGNAQNLHKLQCNILRRGLELLKDGGLLAYSTCSMNPIEDEAVIAALLREAEGKLALEDISQKLPGLIYKPGVSSWVVMDREMKVLNSVADVPPEATTYMHASLFPPADHEAGKFNLQRCIRILPHQQNTGGFFVAVLKKLHQRFPWEKQESHGTQEAQLPTMRDDSKSIQENEKVEATAPVKQIPAKEKKRRFNGFKEDPFFFMESSDPDWMSLKSSFGLSDQFPVDQLLHRCSSGKKRSIYLVSKRTRNFILANKEESDKSRRDFVKIINAGLRLFSRASSEAGFRICQDGVMEVLPHISPKIQVPANKLDLIALLGNQNVPFDTLSCGGAIRDEISFGSFVLIYNHEPEADIEEPFTMPLVAWKGEFTVALYVSKTFKIHLCALMKIQVPDDKPAEGAQAKTQTSSESNDRDTTNANQ